ncbi:MAG: histidine kinase [Vicinamibacterales bacterium]
MRCLVAANDGGVLAANDERIWHLRARSQPSAIVAAPLGVAFNNLNACMRESSDGGLWIGTRRHGMALMRNGRLETSSDGDRVDGLVGNLIVDREGSTWAGSTAGLHRFRKPVVQTTGAPTTPSFVFVDSADSVWTGPATAAATHLRRVTATGARQVVDAQQQVVVAIGQDANGRVWLSNGKDIGYIANGRFVPVRDAANASIADVTSFKQDGRGQLWAMARRVGVYRVSPGPPRLVVASRGAGYRFLVSARFGIWMSLGSGGVEQHVDGRTNVFVGPSPTPTGNDVRTIVEDDDSIWLGTLTGLRRWRNGQWTDWTAQHGLPGAGVVYEIATDRFERFWLMTRGGILILPRGQLDATADGMPQPLSFARIGALDGVVPHPGNMMTSPRVTSDSRGRVYFATVDSFVRVDPSEVTQSSLALSVVLESVTIDNRVVDHTTPQTFVEPSRLQFDYTSLSLRSPENARFRYRLEGYDPTWIEAGGERHVTYGTLRPGAYRFRVTGAGSEGVWSETDASFAFQVVPVFWRTWWFRLTMLGLGALIVSGLYQLRLRQLTRQFQLGMEARVSERTRIARELHDTLLQTFQGVLIHFHVATNLLPGRPEEARRKLDELLDRAAKAIAEGRDAVQGLRASAESCDDLAQSIIALGEELTEAPGEPAETTVLVNVEGHSRRLRPILRDDVYRIASEAVRNAVRHAAATVVHVDIHYGSRELRVAIRDDGKGIDAGMLDQRMASGHWGLPGMRERAELIGGTLAVMSRVGAGTEIALSIPAGKAYDR